MTAAPRPQSDRPNRTSRSRPRARRLRRSRTRRVLHSPVAHPLRGNSDAENLRDATRGERLQRVMADAGVASRRACEELIKEGHVSVNGRTVTDLPCWVEPATDRIMVKGRPLRPASDHVYIMLNKPTRTLCAASDEPGADRATVVDLVKHHSGARLFPVGRLDYDTTGLLLLTNDGDLTHRLTHPRFGGLRVYDAVVTGVVPPRALEELNRRLGAKKRPADAPAPIQIIGFDDGRTLVRISIIESRGGTVQDLLGKLGHHVKHLDRVAFGPLTLTGLARGHWRELERREVAALRSGATAPTEPPRARVRKSRPSGASRRPNAKPNARPNARTGPIGAKPGRNHSDRPGSSAGQPARASSDSSGGRSAGRPSAGRSSAGRPQTARPAADPRSGDRSSTGRPSAGSNRGPSRDSSRGPSRGPSRGSSADRPGSGGKPPRSGGPGFSRKPGGSGGVGGDRGSRNARPSNPRANRRPRRSE
jgi:23S rRNA pseudouridine2605 synthase